MRVSFQILDYTACNQLQLWLTCREVHKRTCINKWRTCNTHVHLFSTQVLQHFCILTQLCTTHNWVITEKASLAAQHILIRNKLHFSNKVSHLLAWWHERAWPRWGILTDTSLIRRMMTCTIAHSHTNARIGNATYRIHLCIILFAHYATCFKTNFLHILAFVWRSGESVINPQERTNLHLLVRLPQLFHSIGT